MSTATTERAVETKTITTKIPARLDRLPWAKFHWLVLIGLGTAWILDGLEVTIVGAIAARLTESGSGIAITTADIGTAAAVYVAGACVGALFFGQLTDRFGRKKLFLLTLGIYIPATPPPPRRGRRGSSSSAASSPEPASAASTRRSTRRSTS